jgi:Lon protease-like protein
MSKLIPIFPLELVVFPGESLNLHIFEPRYRELIGDCEAKGIIFGIPAVVNKQLAGLGTTVELIEITQRYDDGRMDIKTRGLEVFKFKKIVREMPGKLYSGAEVTMLKDDMTGDEELLRQVLASARLLHKLLKVEKKLGDGRKKLTSYDLAHHVGMNLAQEFELLKIRNERERLEYLDQHLGEIHPLVKEMETLKERIQLNGHFKKLPGFEL